MHMTTSRPEKIFISLQAGQNFPPAVWKGFPYRYISLFFSSKSQNFPARSFLFMPLKVLKVKSVKWPSFIKVYNSWPPLTPHLQKLVCQPLPSYFPSNVFKKDVKMFRGSHYIRYWAVLLNLTHSFYFICIQGGWKCTNFWPLQYVWSDIDEDN